MTIERFLAELYTDDAARDRFAKDPFRTALDAGFGEEEAREIARLDPESLALAARSFSRKRVAKKRLAEKGSLFRRLMGR